MAHTRFALRLLAASAVALAMAACNDDTSARIDAPEPPTLAELAVVSDLPAAAPAPVRDYVPDRGYPLAERAYGMQQAFYDVPPDYGFAYDDGRSYVWETADDWEMYAEPWDDGYRYYYYEPGAAYPYFVRDRNYGYGFSSVGVLVAVFDSGGRYLSRDYAYRAAPIAGRYWSRGHELWQARRAAPRLRVDERVWVDQAPRLVRTSDPWLKAAREDRDWRAWRARDNDRELQRFTREQQRREASAAAWRQRLARQGSQDDRRAERVDRREVREDLSRDVQVDRERAVAEPRRDPPRRTEQANRAEQRQAQAAQALRQSRAEEVGRQQAERRAAQTRLAEQREEQQQAREQARARVQAERRQQQAQADRAHQQQQAQVAQRQRQQAERQKKQQEALLAERQGREQARQQQQEQQQARQQAQQEARQQQQQQARQQAQQAARQQTQQQVRAQQAARQKAQQQSREQARAAERQARNANAREKGAPGRDKKE